MRRTCVFLWFMLPAIAIAQAPPSFLWTDGFELCAAPEQYWPDRDADEYGDSRYSFIGCFQPPGFFPVVPGDCDDTNSSIHPDAPEQCNGLDDDCDGQIDEAFPGLGGSCATGQIGVCSIGTLQCQPGGLGLVCNANVLPSPEICNGLDDDCDGQIDEGNVCP